MGRRATGQILTAADRRGGTTYSVRFRGSGYPQSVILLGSSRDGWTRAKAEHEAQIVAAQIRAGTWMPVPRPEYVEGEPYTFRELATDYYHRKRRKGLRPSSLADMLNKLQVHLLPFFGDYRLDQIDEQLVEDYIEHKQRENDRLAAAEAIGRPYLNKAGRPHRPVKASTINTHLHLLAGVLHRAVRDGLIPRNPARGEDLRLAVRRERHYGLELDEAWSLIEAAGDLDREPTASDRLRARIIELRVNGLDWKEIGERVGKAPTTCLYHGRRTDSVRPVPIRRAIIATLTLAGLRVGELCALNCAHVDLAHRVIRVIDAKTPAGVRTVDIHDDLLDELTAYKQSLGDRWQPTKPAFPNRRGGRQDRHGIARHLIAPAVERANELRAEQGLPPISQHVTPHTLRYTYIASMFAAGADQEYVAAQVGHEDITTTNRIYRYVLRRKVRGEIGERRRQLLTAPLKPSDVALNVLLDDAAKASDRPNKGR